MWLGGQPGHHEPRRPSRSPSTPRLRTTGTTRPAHPVPGGSMTFRLSALCVLLALAACKGEPTETDSDPDTDPDTTCDTQVFYADADQDGAGDPDAMVEACEDLSAFPIGLPFGKPPQVLHPKASHGRGL